MGTNWINKAALWKQKLQKLELKKLVLLNKTELQKPKLKIQEQQKLKLSVQTIKLQVQKLK